MTSRSDMNQLTSLLFTTPVIPPIGIGRVNWTMEDDPSETIDDLRLCRKCLEYKPETEFYRVSKGRGPDTKCKSCAKEISAENHRRRMQKLAAQGYKNKNQLRTERVREAILHALKHGPRKTDRVAKMVGISAYWASAKLKQMQADGLVVSSKDSVYWTWRLA